MMCLAVLSMLLAVQQSAPPPAKTSKPIGSFDENDGTPRPFQSVGVRGTIDSGGYAAPASAKQQSEFFTQLTDLQVAVLRHAWAPSELCEAGNSARRTAVALLVRGEYAAAVKLLEENLRASDRPAMRQLLGLAYEGLGQYAAAAEQFRAAASPFAESVALLLAGDFAHAEVVSRGAFEYNRLSLGSALFQRGEVAQALALFLDAANARPADSAAFEFVAIAVRSPDAATSAERTAESLRSLTLRSPQNASAHYALACALSVAHGDGMETELKQALALDPRLADAHVGLGAVYAERGDLPAAITEYSSALDIDPRLIELHYRLGQLYARHGDLQLTKEQLALHQQLRAQQKRDNERGKVALRFPGGENISCP